MRHITLTALLPIFFTSLPLPFSSFYTCLWDLDLEASLFCSHMGCRLAQHSRLPCKPVSARWAISFTRAGPLNLCSLYAPLHCLASRSGGNSCVPAFGPESLAWLSPSFKPLFWSVSSLSSFSLYYIPSPPFIHLKNNYCPVILDWIEWSCNFRQNLELNKNLSAPWS